MALPFSRGVLMWGRPIEVERGADLAQARARVEAEMNELAAQADLAVGRVPIEPAPL